MIYEFYLFFKRSSILTLRSPIGIIFLMIMALSNSFILSTVFGGVGKNEIKISKNIFENKKNIVAYNRRIVTNWLGTVSFIATDLFTSMAMAQVL